MKSAGIKPGLHISQGSLRSMVFAVNSGFRTPVPVCVCSAFRVKAQCDKMRNLGWGRGLEERSFPKTCVIKKITVLCHNKHQLYEN